MRLQADAHRPRRGSCSSTSSVSGYAFDVELLMRARARGLRVAEVPVTYVHDHDSRVNPLTASPRMARGPAAAGVAAAAAARLGRRQTIPTETPVGSDSAAADQRRLGLHRELEQRVQPARGQLELGALVARSPAQPAGPRDRWEQGRVEVGGHERLPARRPGAAGAAPGASSAACDGAPRRSGSRATCARERWRPAARRARTRGGAPGRRPRRRPRARARRWRRPCRRTPASNGSASTPACTTSVRPRSVTELDGARLGLDPRAGPSRR